MEKKPRSLTVSESAECQPRIILEGAWLRDWGFANGDQVTVTRTDTGDILIKFTAQGIALSPMEGKCQHGNELPPPAIKFSPFRLRMMQRQVEKATEAHRKATFARAARSYRPGKSNLYQKSF